MKTISEEDQRAKMKFICAFFDYFDDKVVYLSELYKAGRRDEARILCSCYIDALALALCWPDDRTKLNYVRILKEHGGNSIFSYIHPKMLDEALSRLSKGSNKRSLSNLFWTQWLCRSLTGNYGGVRLQPSSMIASA